MLKVARLYYMREAYDRVWGRLLDASAGSALPSVVVKLLIKPWISPLVKGLLDRHVQLLNTNRRIEVEWTGFPTTALDQIKLGAQEMQDVYIKHAYGIPQLSPAPPESETHDHDVCRTCWRKFWMDSIAPRLREEPELLRAKLFDLLLKGKRNPGLEPTCRAVAIIEINLYLVSSGIDAIIRKTISTIEDLVAS